MAGPLPGWAIMWSTTTHPLAGRRGRGAVGGPERQRGRRTGRPRGGGATGTAGGGGADAPQKVCVRSGEGEVPSTEEGANLQGFTPARSHLYLHEFYGDFPHQNYGTNLTGGIPDDAVWQSRWKNLAAQPTSWYSTPLGKVGCWFTAVLTAELRGVLGWKRESKRPLVFAHVVLTSTLSIRKARNTRVRIDLRIDF